MAPEDDKTKFQYNNIQSMHNTVYKITKLVSLAPILVYFSISLFALRELLFAPGFPTWGDNLVPINSFQWVEEVHRNSFLWDPTQLAGRPFISVSEIISIFARLPFLFIAGIPESALKLFLIFAFTLPGMGMYFLSYSQNKKKLGSFLAGFFFMINPWTVDRLISGHIDMLIGYGIIPIVFTLVYLSTRDRMISKMSLLAGLVGSVASIQLHMFYLLIIILIIYGLFSFFAELRKKDINLSQLQLFKFSFRYKFAPSLIAVTIMLVANSYWIIPLTLSPIQLSSHFPPEEATFVLSREGSIANGYMMSTYWMRYLDHTAHQILNPTFYNFWFVLSILLLFITIASIFFYKSPLAIFFAFLLAIGIFLSKGTSPPFGAVYLFLYNHFPLFFAFRDPSKWVVLTAFSYSYLLGNLVNHLTPKMLSMNLIERKNYILLLVPTLRKNLFSKNFLIVLVSFLLVGNFVFPFFIDGSYGGNVRLVNFPKEYTDLSNWLLTQKQDNRIALFPPDFQIRYDWAPYGITDPIYTYPSKPMVALKDFEYATKDNLMAWWLYHTLYNNNTKYAGKLFGLMGVKDLIIRQDAHPDSYKGGLMDFSNKTVNNYIDKQVGLGLVYKKGNISIYQNQYVLPHIYGVNNLTLAIGNRNILNSLAYMNYSFPKYPIVFINDLMEDQLTKLLPFFRYIIIDVNEYNDLFFFFANEDNSNTVKNLDDYVANKQDSSSNWISSDFTPAIYPHIFDSQLEKFAFTSGKANLTLPIELHSNGKYVVWTKIFKDKDVAKLVLKIDNYYVFITGANNNYDKSSNSGFKWVKLGTINSNRGRHLVELQSQGINAVSRIAFIPQQNVETISSKTNSFLKQNSGKVIYLSEGENLIFSNNSNIKKVDFRASNGYALESINGKAFLTLNIPTNGDYIFGALLNKESNKATVNLLINDKYLASPDHNLDYNLSRNTNDNNKNNNHNFVYFQSNKVHLNQGINNLTVDMRQGILLDQLIVFPSKLLADNGFQLNSGPWNMEQQQHFSKTSGGNKFVVKNTNEAAKNQKQLIPSNKNNASNIVSNLSSFDRLNFKEENPVKYDISDVAFPIIIFLESKNSGWRMIAGETKGQDYSFPVWSYANMFIADKRDNSVIEYTPEIYYNIGVTISISCVLLVVATILISTRKLKYRCCYRNSC
jgi:hypothetical protein